MHARVTTFGVDSVADLFERELAALTGVRGVVLDIRENGGGSQTPG